MNYCKLNCETILDLYTHKNKKFLCLIKVSPESGKFRNSCRFLSEEHWSIFDKELEKIISTEDDWDNGKCLKFKIKSVIHVGVQKSNLSFKEFYKCLDTIGDSESSNDEDDSNEVLECQFDFQQDVPFNFPIELQESEPNTEAILDNISCSPSSLKQKYITGEIDADRSFGVLMESAEDIHSPNQVFEKSVVNRKLTNPTHMSKPIMISRTCCTTDNNKFSQSATELKDVNELNEFRSRSNSNSSTQSDIFMLDTAKNEDKLPSRKSYESLRRKSKKKIKRITRLDIFSDEETTKKEKVPQTNNIRIDEERSKSDNILLELNNENTKEKHSSIKDREKQSQIRTKEKKDDKICSLKEKITLSERKDKTSIIEDEVPKTTKKKSNTHPTTARIECVTDSTADTSPKNERKTESCSKDITIVRRSERSPTKPKRFISEQFELLAKTKSKKLKISQKNEELFGTDDDADDLCENAIKKDKNSNKMKSSIFETPVCKKSDPCISSLSTSTKKKRKLEKSSECQQEKRDISKWLSKKKLIPSDRETAKSLKTNNKTEPVLSKPLPLKSSIKMKSRQVNNNSETRSQSGTASPITLELPSKEELEMIRSKTKLTQKENARVRAELDKMRSTPPKKIEILSLQNMSIDDILDTFSTYKSELDEIYENNHKRDYIKGHGGINHCFVIRLLDQNIQMKMLEKLTEVYSNSTGITQATLFANALLPEWVIRVYMEKFKFTRQEAIEQVKAQEEYQLHMEEQNDNSFTFD